MFDLKAKWYCLNKQNPNEVFFLKTFDSKTDVRASCKEYPSYFAGSVDG